MADDNPDLAPRRKKPPHTSSNQTVGSFADFATTTETKFVHPAPCWDDVVPTDAVATPHALPCIPCGLYEIDEPGGSTIQIRVRLRRGGKYAGQFAVEWLVGADGLTWEPFAAVNDAAVDIPRAHTNTDYGLVTRNLYQHVYHGELIDGWEFRLAKPACARCGRELKHGEAGIHASCQEKWSQS